MEVFTSIVLGVFIIYVFWEFANVYRQIGICLDAINETRRSVSRTPKEPAPPE